MSEILTMIPQGVADGVLGCQYPNTAAGDFSYSGTNQTRIDINGNTVAVADNTPPISYEFGVDECPVLKLAGDAVCQGAQFEDVASGGVWKMQLSSVFDGTERNTIISNGADDNIINIAYNDGAPNILGLLWSNTDGFDFGFYELVDETELNNIWVRWEKKNGHLGDIDFMVNGIVVAQIKDANIPYNITTQDFELPSGGLNMIGNVGQNTISNNLDDFNTSFNTVDEMATFAKFNKQ